MTRPERLVVVLGTGTEVGKTWVSCRLLDQLRAEDVRVAARKPAQSFDPPAVGATPLTDADVLAASSGEPPSDVCPPHRSYPLALAPPMAAARLGRPAILLEDLVSELRWPSGVRVGLVETAGGARSPLADDADSATLAHRVGADLAVLVADAGLGTIHAVRSSAAALEPLPLVVVLNRFDSDDSLHHDNLEWLRQRDGFDVVTEVADVVTRLSR